MSTLIKSERIIPCDVDDTLIMHLKPRVQDSYILIQDPVDAARQLAFVVNENMVRILKEEKLRGSFTIVWSRNGYDWAQKVVEALCLEKYVDLIMSKPISYLDDTPVEKWMVDRVYIEHTKNYKNSQF